MLRAEKASSFGAARTTQILFQDWSSFDGADVAPQEIWAATFAGQHHCDLRMYANMAGLRHEGCILVPTRTRFFALHAYSHGVVDNITWVPRNVKGARDQVGETSHRPMRRVCYNKAKVGTRMETLDSSPLPEYPCSSLAMDFAD